MLSGLIIVFREVLEMSIVLGLLFAATRGVKNSRKWILTGCTFGLVGALIVAFFMEALENSIEGAGEFVFNAVVLLIASGLLASTVLWMAQHGRAMSQHLRAVGASVAEGSVPVVSLMIVSFAAVMREGSEAVFFMFGALQTGQETAALTIGGLLGFAAGGALGLLLYFGLVRIPMKHLFSVMSMLLMLLAAGMASQAAMNLVLVDMLPPLVDTLWDSSSWLSEDSVVGSVLQVMVGYYERPNGMQLIVFLSTLGVMGWLYQRAQRQAI